VPVNHKIFSEINEAQWLWYFHNICADEKEDFEFRRDLIEYSSSFSSFEAVSEIRKKREEKENILVSKTNEEFNIGLQRLFGRGLDGDIESDSKDIKIADPKKAIEAYNKIQSGYNKKTQEAKKDYKYWLGIDLEDS